jgi:hypothetical protein
VLAGATVKVRSLGHDLEILVDGARHGGAGSLFPVTK